MNPSVVRLLEKYLIGLCVIAVILFTVFPLAWIILTSVKPANIAVSYPPRFFFTPTLEHYGLLLSGSGGEVLGKAFINSILTTGISMIVTLLVACPAAYSLSRLKPAGGAAIVVFIIGVRMLPPIVLVVPLFRIFQSWGITDTQTALIIPYVGLSVPLATWMMIGFFLNLPKELEEAAMIDGCGRIKAFWHVILPLAAPGLAATSIFTGLLAWNDLVFSLPLTTVDAVTLPVIASRMRVEEGVLWGQLGAVSTIMIIPVILLTFFVQRHIVQGIASGAVKG
ncbi:carbohydrate ABC transporter permease [Microvirga pakistanensis]|uniref:carbohydrate ABC transporter permease n=1 Tax=Microvirga pakistanensis TaxID=1682650 RepID=UPI00106955E2|nr:carbohydrate ABC transporter permease [Microvirga pakistanensis]